MNQENNNEIKTVTMNDLALSMKTGFERVETLIEKRIDGLTISTAKGFEEVHKKIDDKIDEAKEELKENTLYHTRSINNRIDDLADNRVTYDKFNPLVKKVEELGKV